MLEALQILQVKVPGGGAESRRLSFRALDIEQIGHVYEGLLDAEAAARLRAAVRATVPVLGLVGSKDKNPEVALEVLERELEKGEDKLIEFLKKETGRAESALRKALLGDKRELPSINPQEEARFLVACNNDRSLWQRVRPFMGLIRKDTFDYPTIIPQGS